MVKIAESLTGISFQRNEGMIKKSAFIVSQKSRLNMGKLGVYNATNVLTVANNF